ncbi:DUF887-domain-containing protein [Pterulicium gracile]|uniref:DUF887-domain-containing protein n=1 Tax=Pterulicium gracile TaxID=1884261 RepID=A0A5C3QMZ9_9AGAR|nr:DUF887-domain-containing protein [Pterula gracilis]
MSLLTELTSGARFQRLLERIFPKTMGLIYTHLPKLPAHLHVFVGSVGLFTATHLVFGPWLCKRLWPTHYGTVKKWGEKNKWAIRVASQVHALAVVPMAVRCLGIPALNSDRMYGWDDRAGTLHAFACGYFLWDTVDAIVNYTDAGFIVHGLCCLSIYTLSFKPFVNYFGARCLLWEASTVFLNNNWILDKTGRTGSKLQFYNGALLLSAFAGVRLIYGGKMSYDFWVSLYNHRHQISTLQWVLFGGGNIVLQGLNWYWFSKMIVALRRRFRPSGPLPGPEKANGNGRHVENGNGKGFTSVDEPPLV